MMNIYYENSQGVKLDLLSEPYRLQTGDIFDYAWEYSSIARRRNGGKITGFSKGIQSKKLMLGVMAGSCQKYNEALNTFHDIVEYDVQNLTPGRLWVGNQYLICYVITSTKTDWESDIEVLDNEIEIVTDYPFWCVDKLFTFRMNKEIESDYLDYAFDYPFDYAPPSNIAYLVSEHHYDCDFKCTIYGPCTNPRFMIGTHIYEIFTTLYDGEYLVFDSRDNTLIKVDYQGIISNIYNSRNKEYSIFKRIPPGRNVINWNRGFDFDITCFCERSEPKW